MSNQEFFLSDFISVKHGFAFKGDFITTEENENCLLTPGNFMIGGGFKSDKFKYFSGDIPQDYILKEDDLIITMTDLSKQGDTLGYSALVPSIYGKKMLHNQRIGLVEFKNAEFKNAIEELSNYRIYFELKQGGITILSTKKDSINFTLYMKAIDFDINFKDAIKLNDIYELQKENLEELIFEFSVNNFNNFQYYYEINSKEEIAPKDYKILSNNTLLISESLNIGHFKDGFTYLHFFLKDSFENVKYKKYKITTKNNTFTLLNILNKEITLSKLDEEFSIFYESRNITQLKPIIQYKVNGESFQKEGTNIGTFNQDKKMFLLNLKEQFSNIESNEVFLFFILNNNEKLISNEVFISIDNEEPEVEIQEYYLIKNKF